MVRLDKGRILLMMGHSSLQMNNFPDLDKTISRLQQTKCLMNFKSWDFFPDRDFTNSIMVIVC